MLHEVAPLHVSCNSSLLGNTINLKPFLGQLIAMLPTQWRVEVARPHAGIGNERADALLTITAPDGSAAQLLVEFKSRLSARQASIVGAELSGQGRNRNRPGGILFTRYASAMSQKRLRDAGVSYLDLTGNAWISIKRPAVFIERQGADADPDPPRRGVQSLKGAKAGRIVRALCDWRPPVGVRELARRTDADPGYVTRVLSLLEDEDVIDRASTGGVAEVRWQDLLRRWSRDYSLTGTNRTVTGLAPRGLRDLQDRLTNFDEPYAVTGSFAVPPEAQVIPGRLFSCYVSGPEFAAERLDVRPTDAGANVLLVEPVDGLVFDRTREAGGLTVVALSQCVVDLLTGSGREPAQADALMSWMAEDEDAWRI